MTSIDAIISNPRLPSLPGVALRLLDLVNNEEAGIRDIIEVVQTDPALTARMIQAANASTLGLQRNVTSLDLAVALLGKTVVTSIALSFSLVSKSSGPTNCQDFFEDYWLRSVVQATIAKMFGRGITKTSPDELFIVGLLCDVGRLAMLTAIPEAYAEVLEQARQNQRVYIGMERELLGFGHDEVGYQLAHKWNLPATVQDSIRDHHVPFGDSFCQVLEGDHRRVAWVSAHATELLTAEGSGEILDELHSACRELFGLEPMAVKSLLMSARKEIDKVAALLAADSSRLGDTEAILWQANNQLLKMTLTAQAVAQRVAVENAELKEQNKSLASETEDLRSVALRDALTGLPNPHFLKEFLPREISRCQRSETAIGIVFCDVDHFKRVNDTYGHVVGDQVLRHVAQVMEQSLRKHDVLVRHGGEEFVAVTTGADQTGMELIAERIRKSVEDAPIELDTGQLRITVSVGGAYAVPKSTDVDRDGFAKRLLDAADQAMYESKRAGRNRWRVVDLRADAGPIPPAARPPVPAESGLVTT